MGKIYWLASYPKSGNTWLRILLTNYWRNADTPADINQLDSTPIASSRMLFENLIGMEASDLSAEEIDHLRPAVYRSWAESQSELHFAKVHDAYSYLPNGQALFPRDCSAGAIYLIRNPLDVATSFAAHNGQTVDKMIKQMANDRYVLSESRQGLNEQLRQKLGSWSSHVCSWLDQDLGFPVLVVRYEDLFVNPAKEFGVILRFLNEEIDHERIRKAITFSQFEQLQNQENQHGFKERSGAAKQFFRKGQTGTWQQELSTAQVAQILSDHQPVMTRFGYICEPQA